MTAIFSFSLILKTAIPKAKIHVNYQKCTVHVSRFGKGVSALPLNHFTSRDDIA